MTQQLLQQNMLLSNVYSLQPLESCHVSRTYHVSFRISNASLNVTYRQLFVIARNPLRTAMAQHTQCS